MHGQARTGKQASSPDGRRTETILDDPGGTAVLLATLHQVGAAEHASVVAGRASREASLSEPQGIVALLDAVRKTGGAPDGSFLLRRAVDCPRMPSSVPGS